MCDDSANDDPKAPADEKTNNEPKLSLSRRIGELLLYMVFIFADAEGVWPHSPILALLIFIAGTIGLALYDGGFSVGQVCAIGIICFLMSGIIYYSVPPPLRPETPDHGWLEAAGKSFPPKSSCSDAETVLPDGMLFSLGKPEMWMAKKTGGRRPLLTVGACTLMSAEYGDNQLLFNADIYDENHELIARIERNEFHLVPNKYAYTERPNRSTLSIYDKKGKLLLRVHRPNKDAMQVSGDFICLDGKEAKTDEDGDLTMTGPKGTITWDHKTLCLINTGGFVVTEFGFGIGPTPCWALDPNDNSVATQYRRNICRVRGEPTPTPGVQ